MKLNMFQVTRYHQEPKTALAASGFSYVEGCWTCSTTRPTTFHVWKTRGCQCSFRLLVMGGVSPETCWASYKYGIIKLWYIIASCWIFLYELYYDAWIHDHQISVFFVYCLILKATWLRSFDTLRTTHQTTELDIPGDLHLQQHCVENLKSHGTFLLMESAGISQKFWWSFSCDSFLNQRKETTCHCLIFTC
jgi:hypothetical protein